jgi:hypothetical protein
MFIQVAVETSQNLSAKQRELLEAFEPGSTKGSKGNPDHEGFFAKVAAFRVRRVPGIIVVGRRSGTNQYGPKDWRFSGPGAGPAVIHHDGRTPLG